MRFTGKQTARLGAILGLLFAAPLILAPNPCNLEVAEYPGSSEKEGREDTSDVFAVEHKLTVPYDPATGQATGVRVHSPLVVVKMIDKATPGFHKALCTGQNLQEVILYWYRIDPDSRREQKYYIITLTHARIVTIEPYMPMSFLPENEAYRHMERVSFVYEQIEWNWLPDSVVEMDTWHAPGGPLKGIGRRERQPEQEVARLVRRGESRQFERDGTRRTPVNDRRQLSRTLPVDATSNGG